MVKPGVPLYESKAHKIARERGDFDVVTPQPDIRAQKFKDAFSQAFKPVGSHVHPNEPIYGAALEQLLLSFDQADYLEKCGWEVWAGAMTEDGRAFEMRNYAINLPYISAARQGKDWVGLGADQIIVDLMDWRMDSPIKAVEFPKNTYENVPKFASGGVVSGPFGLVGEMPSCVIGPILGHRKYQDGKDVFRSLFCDQPSTKDYINEIAATYPEASIGWDYGASDPVNDMKDAMSALNGNSGVNAYPGLDTAGKGRLDSGKEPFHRLPPEFLFALAKHYDAGARKYPTSGGRGWEKGMQWGRCFSSAMRHVWKFWMGENIDEETGSHHLIAAIWNLVAIYTYSVRDLGEDDRPC